MKLQSLLPVEILHQEDLVAGIVRGILHVEAAIKSRCETSASICWEQSDTWALDNVLQELGRERTIAMSLPEFEQSLFMAAQPDNLLLATAPRYCQYYNQLHQLPLVALPLPFDESQQKKLEVPFTLLWHKRNSHNPKIVWLRDTIKNLYASMA
ncbi:hypothetical protein BY70_06615 [Escherichia coli O157:H7 str. K2192]|nr:hypothetical protein BY70_06615 [Escherichia coli O157:H7 str. K2192]